MSRIINTVLLALAAASAAAAGSATARTEAPLAVDPADPSLQWGPCPPVFPGACEIAVLHGDPAQPNADVLLKVASGYEIPPHRHSSAERMILVDGQLRVRYQGADPVILNPGHYAYGPAGLPHEAECVSATSCTLFIAFEGPVDADAVSEGLK